jgi:hypothetical protein
MIREKTADTRKCKVERSDSLSKGVRRAGK